ncbi:Ion channel CASTOR [Gracilariopsis chorda]|uniref:Ion channel CASTOR n=1 Tax=Gracilariopsis chorda TaxID=448386 RepID=A0A2V3IPX9_9FLOR|nr:Ion channel CASTOR [Gracilariopsis chorda]|eukprot:PXF44132.1 Ion channel CASTOR [Gracilariopsis chorda]
MPYAFLAPISLNPWRLRPAQVCTPLPTTFRIAASLQPPTGPPQRPARTLSILAALSVFFSTPSSLAAPAAHPAQLPANTIPAVTRTVNRHVANGSLVMVTRPKTLASVQSQFTIKDHLSFWMGEFLMWNASARVIALLAFTLMFMYLGSFLYRLADPKKQEAAHPFWHSVRAIANPLEDDWENNYLRATSITLAAIGMVFFAILVGMVTESVESAVQAVDGASSKVVTNDHILICGWSSHVSQMLKDLTSVSKRVPVVVLAKPEQKDTIFTELREGLSEEEWGRLRVFYRPGVPMMEADLSRVAASRARKIILIAERHGDVTDSDRQVLSRAMALRQNLPAFTGDIVAELRSERDERILKGILSETKARSVETVNADKLLYRFMAQAIRQPGLADVVAEMMGDDAGCVFHVRKAGQIAPHVVGQKLSDLKATCISGSMLCGMFENGVVHIGLDKDVVIQARSELLVLGEKGGARDGGKAVRMSRSAGATIRALRLNDSGGGGKKKAERYLVCGWRADMRDMLKELDDVLGRGSHVTILDEDAPIEVREGLKKVSVTAVRKRADRYENLEEVISGEREGFDHVVVLASAIGADEVARGGGMEADTQTIASVAYINELVGGGRGTGGGGRRRAS